jgi:hypothetical protein
VFLDDCFASDSAVAALEPYFDVRDFRIIFPDARKGKQNAVPDTPVIKKCHEEKWLLLTTNHEMLRTHMEEIKKHPDVTILLQRTTAQHQRKIAHGSKQSLN